MRSSSKRTISRAGFSGTLIDWRRDRLRCCRCARACTALSPDISVGSARFMGVVCGRLTGYLDLAAPLSSLDRDLIVADLERSLSPTATFPECGRR